MPNQDCFTMVFERDTRGLPILQRTYLKTAQGLEATALNSSAEVSGGFAWNLRKGKLRIFALAIVRAARLVNQAGAAEEKFTRLFQAEKTSSETRKCTETQFYDLTTYKGCDWLEAILSPKRDWQDARNLFTQWFRAHNIRGSDSSGPPSIDLDLTNLRPEGIDIYMGPQLASPEELDWLESVLAAHIDGSFPPYSAGEKRQTAGFMPFVGPSFGNREAELSLLDQHYHQGDSSLVEIVGESGIGKTALARWWMRQLSVSQGYNVALVFSWSFPRQSRSDGTRQSLGSFFRALGNALGVPLTDGLAPQQLANLLLAGLHRTPTFLFIDGVETLINQLGSFNIGGKRSEGDATDSEAAFHQDSFYYLLRGIVAPGGTRFAFVLATTRISISKILNVEPPVAHTLELEEYKGESYVDDELARKAALYNTDESIPLRDLLAKALKTHRSPARKKGSTARVFGKPMAEFREVEVPLSVQFLVRKSIEQFGLSPERCLIYVVSCFDRPADWDAVMHVLRLEGGAAKLNAAWTGLSEREWHDHYEELEEANLVLPSGGGEIAMHPLVQECVYEDFRKGMPEDCAKAHRTLCSYFAAIPPLLPDGIEEMRPLFRACWHGCNAGDFRDTFREIAYRRISRKWEAYIMHHLCEFEETLQVLNLFTEDGETFPASDLDEDTRTTIIHACGLCLRYLDRLQEAYRVERIAWQRSKASKSRPQLGAIAANYLRLQHMFGDLNDAEVAPVLFSLLQGVLPRLDQDANREKIPSTLIPQAFGYIAGAAALVLACTNSTTRARICLKTAKVTTMVGKFRSNHLMPGLGAPHHALACLELGDWQTVLKAFEAGEFKSVSASFVQTGTLSYLHGCALGQSSRDVQIQARALALLEDCVSTARGNFRWWHAIAMVAIGKLKLRMNEIDGAMAAFEEALDLAVEKRNQFKLVEVDSYLGIAECYKRSQNRHETRASAEKALLLLKKCGYSSRLEMAEHFARF